MTVADLITYLSKLPRNTQIGVVFKVFSDLSILEESDLEFRDKTKIDTLEEERRSGKTMWSNERRRYIIRHGKLMEYNEQTFPPDETPEFVPLLILPGN